MPQSVDVDLTSEDIAALTSPDAIAAWLHRLGYSTEGRQTLAPAALGLVDESAVRKLELLSEDADQFLRIYLAQVKSITAKTRNEMVRVLGKLNKDHLLILTKDFSQFEFVLIVKVQHSKNLGDETGYKPIARTIPISRSSTDRTLLRILRRFTWTAIDGLAQYDKLKSVFEAAAFSGEYFQNRALFSDHFLTTRLKTDSAWSASPNTAFQKIRVLLDHAKPQVVQKDEDVARKHLFHPLFAALGFKPHANPPVSTGEPVADYDLLDHSGSIRAAALVYQWDRWLDGPDDRDTLTPNENPGAAVVSLLEKGDVSWVIVTNGRHWRLYSRSAHSRSTNFYEIELEEALQAGDGIDPNEAFRYFWLFFRVEAFLPSTVDGKTLWLDAVVQGSRDYAREVERELKKRVFERVVPFLAKGFLADRAKRLGIKKQPDEKELETIRQGTLTLLYRILFLLYAESRDLLPVRESPYFELSLKKIEKEIAEQAGTAESTSDEKLASYFSKDKHTIYSRLATLCEAMDGGDSAVNVPTYNGGLFRTKNIEATSNDRDAVTARFLRDHHVPDLFLAAAIDHLARVPDQKQGFGLAFVDYKSLGVRQLGSIYEGLLEYRLFVADDDLVEVKEKSKIAYKPLTEIAESKRNRKDVCIVRRGDVYLANNKAERKSTGSYYTPENIVVNNVASTVGPVLQRKLELLVSDFRAAEKTYHRELKNAENDPRLLLGSGLLKAGAKAAPEQLRAWAAGQAYDAHQNLVEKLFDLKVLDAAMGSGHFLVESVDFVTDRLLVWLNQFRPFNPVLVMLDRTRRNILDSLNTQGVNIDPDRLTDVHLLKRHVLKRCIYGVDLNPLATELAKVSLWLDAFTLGAPLSFLDHHLRVGNSLVGATFDDLQKLTSGSLFAIDYEPMLRAVRNVLIVSRLSDTTAAEVHESANKYGSARQALDGYRLVLDLIVAQYFGQPKGVHLITDAGDLSLDSREHFLMQLNGRDAQIVRDVEVVSEDRRFFHWELEFPEVFFHYKEGSKQQIEKRVEGDAGFDCIVGNPPYVRQETLKDDKAFLKSAYAPVYDAANDLYVFFMYREIQVLRRDGLMSMIVANKWLRAGYGEKLRKYLKRFAKLTSIVDFGHAPIFPDADTFPCVPVFGRRLPALGADELPPQNESWLACSFPREDYDSRAPIADYVARHSFPITTRLLRDDVWSLEDPCIQALMERIRNSGKPLREYVGSAPCRGPVSGCNEAFYIDETTRERLIREDKHSAELIKPLLRGRDIDRWKPRVSGMHILLCRRGVDIDRYPAIKKHLQMYRAKLEPKPATWDDARDGLWPGRATGDYKWYELQASPSDKFVAAMEEPRLMYQVILFHSFFALATEDAIHNDKAFIIPAADLWLLAVLNSRLMWWYMTRLLPHMKDEALATQGNRMELLPIVAPTQQARNAAELLIAAASNPESSAESRLKAETELSELVSMTYGLSPDEIELLSTSRAVRDPLDVQTRRLLAGETVVSENEGAE